MGRCGHLETLGKKLKWDCKGLKNPFVLISCPWTQKHKLSLILQFVWQNWRSFSLAEILKSLSNKHSNTLNVEITVTPSSIKAQHSSVPTLLPPEQRENSPPKKLFHLRENCSCSAQQYRAGPFMHSYEKSPLRGQDHKIICNISSLGACTAEGSVSGETSAG